MALGSPFFLRKKGFFNRDSKGMTRILASYLPFSTHPGRFLQIEAKNQAGISTALVCFRLNDGRMIVRVRSRLIKPPDSLSLIFPGRGRNGLNLGQEKLILETGLRIGQGGQEDEPFNEMQGLRLRHGRRSAQGQVPGLWGPPVRLRTLRRPDLLEKTSVSQPEYPSDCRSLPPSFRLVFARPDDCASRLQGDAERPFPFDGEIALSLPAAPRRDLHAGRIP